MRKPSNGSMIYWRPKGSVSYHFGYVSYTDNYELIRLGPWNGCDWQGPIVDWWEIEWKPYDGRY